MNTPLILFYKKLPLELINHIQTYIVNEIPKKALEQFFYIIIQKQQLYDQFVYYNYILKNCYCFSININDMCCNWCFDYKYSSKYNIPLYNTIVFGGSEYNKIMFDEDF